MKVPGFAALMVRRFKVLQLQGTDVHKYFQHCGTEGLGIICLPDTIIPGPFL